MTKLNYKIYRPRDKQWIDERQMPVPVNRVTKAEKLAERKAGKIVKDALRLNKLLKEFKRYLKEASIEVYNAYLKENNAKPKENYKGNYTWYNFDRSVKIEVNISEPIEFDDITIQLAKEKLMGYLDANVVADDFDKEWLKSAFQTRRGKLDTKKVLDTLHYASRSDKKELKEVAELINKSIRRKQTKSYYKVFIKNAEGGYDYIDLNLSSVKLDNNG